MAKSKAAPPRKLVGKHDPLCTCDVCARVTRDHLPEIPVPHLAFQMKELAEFALHLAAVARDLDLSRAEVLQYAHYAVLKGEASGNAYDAYTLDDDPAEQRAALRHTPRKEVQDWHDMLREDAREGADFAAEVYAMGEKYDPNFNRPILPQPKGKAKEPKRGGIK